MNAGLLMELAEAKARMAATEDARYLEWKAAIERAEQVEAALARLSERVVSDETVTEKLTIERLGNNYAIPRHMIGALLNIIRNERTARQQAEAALAAVPVAALNEINNMITDSEGRYYPPLWAVDEFQDWLATVPAAVQP